MSIVRGVDAPPYVAFRPSPLTCRRSQISRLPQRGDWKGGVRRAGPVDWIRTAEPGFFCGCLHFAEMNGGWALLRGGILGCRGVFLFLSVMELPGYMLHVDKNVRYTYSYVCVITVFPPYSLRILPIQIPFYCVVFTVFSSFTVFCYIATPSAASRPRRISGASRGWSHDQRHFRSLLDPSFPLRPHLTSPHQRLDCPAIGYPYPCKLYIHMSTLPIPSTCLTQTPTAYTLMHECTHPKALLFLTVAAKNRDLPTSFSHACISRTGTVLRTLHETGTHTPCSLHTPRWKALL